MPKRKKLDPSGLEGALKDILSRQSSSADAACNTLGVSQSSFSRLIARLSKEILRVGRAQGTRYALRRSVPDVGETIPIFEIDEKGRSTRAGGLHAVHPRGFYFEGRGHLAAASRFFDGLPYFLDDLRPSGFLGRLVPRRFPELALPERIDDWSAEHCLKYLTRHGSDLIGNLVLGEEAFRRHLDARLKGPPPIDPASRGRDYPRLAEAVLKFGDPGSSAGGEQPKFCAAVGPIPTPVLVKFSPPTRDDVARRRSDLLIAEHIAANTLEVAGHPAAASDVVIAAGQVFLEVKRFDRVGGDGGRRSLLSLRALDAEFVGLERGWGASARALLAQGRIPAEACRDVRWRELFGKLIADTDMHSANLSFYGGPGGILGLAPAYDMLPVLYAPVSGQLVEREFSPPLPEPRDADLWPGALRAALGFWQAVAADPRISDGFRALAGGNAARLEELGGLSDLLPKGG